jgi:hypothetical protein
MGINYYARIPKPNLGIKGNLHIGKKSAGWSFLFRAHDIVFCPVEHDCEPEKTCLKCGEVSIGDSPDCEPAPFTLGTAQGWRDFLSETGMEIYEDCPGNGCAGKIPVDTFFNMIEDSLKEKNHSEVDWVDGKGYSFMDRWFE